MDHQQGFPGALTEIPSGWSAAELDLVPGDGFWARIEQIAVKGEMTRGLDSAMKGQPSPRIWLFLHEPGRGELSAAVAMSFARELAFRDQAVLLLDCDDRDLSLTRWAGRVETEGWIDLARYGTSVLTSGVPLPFVGRRGYMLGVGSFAPTDVTGEEIDTLLTRLRRQGDDLLLVAPADSLGRLWAPAAAIRIFCWDRQTLTDQDAGAIAEGFLEAGCPLTAVATFNEGGPAEEQLVEQVLSEVESAPDSTDIDSGFDFEFDSGIDPGIDPDQDWKSSPEPKAGQKEAESTLEARWRNLPLEEGIEPEEHGLGGADWDEPMPESEPAPGRETSRVFWFGALAAVVLIAVISVYYFKFVRVPSEGHFEQIDVASHIDSPVTGGESGSPEAKIQDNTFTMAAAGDSVMVPVVQENEPGTLPALTVSGGEAVAESLLTNEGSELEADPQGQGRVEAPVTTPAEFDMSPYVVPVGTKGWALHIYSLPDSVATAQEVKELHRRGFASEVRIFDLGEKGRWRRIYLGSFATRAEAKQAMPALLKKLRGDWAKPERFQTSAPE